MILNIEEDIDGLRIKLKEVQNELEENEKLLLASRYENEMFHVTIQQRDLAHEKQLNIFRRKSNKGFRFKYRKMFEFVEQIEKKIQRLEFDLLTNEILIRILAVYSIELADNDLLGGNKQRENHKKSSKRANNIIDETDLDSSLLEKLNCSRSRLENLAVGLLILVSLLRVSFIS